MIVTGPARRRLFPVVEKFDVESGRAKNLLRQLELVRPVISAEETRYAILLITWGLFKKMVLADNFGHIVESIDSNILGHNYFAGAGLLFAYAFAGVRSDVFWGLRELVSNKLQAKLVCLCGLERQAEEVSWTVEVSDVQLLYLGSRNSHLCNS